MDGSISAPRDHSFQPMPPTLEGEKDAGALDHLGLDLGGADAPVERVDDPPAAHALPVEAELVDEEVETAADAVGPDVPAAVAQQRGDVEGRLADDRLRIDGEPRFALGAQDVRALEVLVAEDEVGLRGRKLPRGVLARLDE